MAKKTPPAASETSDAVKDAWRRQIPSVERFLSDPAAIPLVERWGREPVKTALARELDRMRAGDGTDDRAVAAIALRTSEILERQFAPSLRRVINATGVIIHTNLGRSPIDPETWHRAGELVTHYTNLEFDLAAGKRGRRDDHLTRIARELFGCEAAVVTNNNAAAVLLVMSALAPGKEVVVSRGELVEIGGGFRVPDVIQQGGAKLREVGTTNKTRAADYADAAGRRTGAILQVHRSNFEIVGFTESPAIADLVAVGRAKNVPVIVDEGSGRVVDLGTYGFSRRETIRELIEAGVDVVTCSTDKLIGATQGGLILGRRDIVARCAKHPLMRALRAGKETYAIIAATLQAFLAAKHEERIAIYRMMAAPSEALRSRAATIAAAAKGHVIETEAAIGGGTTPTETMQSIGVRIDGNASELHAKLLAREIPIVATIRDGRLTLDVRTVLPEEDDLVIAALRAIA